MADASRRSLALVLSGRAPAMREVDGERQGRGLLADLMAPPPPTASERRYEMLGEDKPRGEEARPYQSHTLRDKTRDLVDLAGQALGMDERGAYSMGRGIAGTPAYGTGRAGLMDMNPLGSLATLQEGVQQIRAGDTAGGALNAAMGAVDVVPGAGEALTGLGKMVAPIGAMAAGAGANSGRKAMGGGMRLKEPRGVFFEEDEFGASPSVDIEIPPASTPEEAAEAARRALVEADPYYAGKPAPRVRFDKDEGAWLALAPKDKRREIILFDESGALIAEELPGTYRIFSNEPDRALYVERGKPLDEMLRQNGLERVKMVKGDDFDEVFVRPISRDK
jgi:hypothetical protein